MKLFIAGDKGQLGGEVANYCRSFNIEYVGKDLPDLDITDLDNVLKTIKDVAPDIIYNCAAYTKVDLSEKEYKEAFLVNGLGARNLALAAKHSKERKPIKVVNDQIGTPTWTKNLVE